MFRFTIRDVLWLTVVVAVLACWLVEHRAALSQAEQAAKRQAENAESQRKLRGQVDAYKQSAAALAQHLKAREANDQAQSTK
jgi:IS5 family transposase